MAYSVKGLCHCCLVHFVKNANNASVDIRYGTWEITRRVWRNFSFVSNCSYVCQALYIKRNKQKNLLWKTDRLTEVFRKKNLNPFQSSSSLSIPCLFLYLLCHYAFFSCFERLFQFMFHSVRWHSHFARSLINFVYHWALLNIKTWTKRAPIKLPDVHRDFSQML